MDVNVETEEDLVSIVKTITAIMNGYLTGTIYQKIMELYPEHIPIIEKTIIESNELAEEERDGPVILPSEALIINRRKMEQP